MDSNNKKRILELIEILRENTDINHTLSLKEIANLLMDKGIVIKNRKTLYDDFKILNEYGYEVEYANGYYLTDNPFSQSELKIIIDSLNSLKNLDDNVLIKLTNKLYSFQSKYKRSLLKKLEYRTKHKDKKFINRLEDVMQSIENNNLVKIKRNNKEEETIAPLFLHRSNDFYYLYYHYENSNKIYHTRFDNIQTIKLLNTKDEIVIPRSTLIEVINASTNAFYSSKAQFVEFKIVKNSDYLRNRINDDFSDAVFTNDGFTVKASINEVFFSKLVSYGTQIKISDKEIADQYISYLKSIINNHTKQ